jgi:hypothetical protein
LLKRFAEPLGCDEKLGTGMANQGAAELMFVIAQQENAAPRIQHGESAPQYAWAIWPVIHQITKLDDEKAKGFRARDGGFEGVRFPMHIADHAQPGKAGITQPPR